MDPFIAILMATLIEFQPSLKPERAELLAEIFVTEAEANGQVTPYELAAVAAVETGRTFRGNVESHAGACGLMQVIPRWQRERHTCEEYKRNDRTSVRVGAQAIVSWRRWENRRCRQGHDYLAHYNSGNRAVPRSLRYARTVRRYEAALQRGAAVRLARAYLRQWYSFLGLKP